MPAILRSVVQWVAARITVATARTATYSGTAFDTLDYDGSAKVILDVGAVTGTVTQCDFQLTESATSGGTYTNISGATAAGLTSAVREINFDVGASKQFIKVSATIAGTTPSLTIAEIFCGVKKYQ
jgi:UDP-N-acetylmuramyl tripeptide synthase